MPEDQALTRLHAILARPEYQSTDAQPWWEQLLAPIWELVLYAITWLIHAIVDAGTGREGPIGVLVLAACAVLVGVVAAYLIRAVGLSMRREDAVRSQTFAERRERSERLARSRAVKP